MIVRPRIRLGQKILGTLITINLVVFAGWATFTSRSVLDLSKLITATESPDRSVIITQRESFVYVIRLTQWSVGLLERRDVQIARASLSQRLSVIDFDGASAGGLASPEYLSALKESDAILQSTVPGLLPAERQKNIQARIGPVIDQIIGQSRALVDAYQQQANARIRENANSKKYREAVSLLLLALLLIMLATLVVWNRRTMYSYFRQSRSVIQRETDKLDRLIEEISLSETTIDKLRELSETKTAFIASVNHELRTPLSSIIGYIEIIRDITDTKPELGIIEYLEVVDRNANVLLGLVNSILTLSKLDSAKAPLANIRVDIAQVIDTAISVLEPDCKKSNIDIHFSITRDVGYFIQGDAGQLNQAILNLLSNSIKFSEVNSHIEIQIDKLNYEEVFSFVRIVIRDHGIGIPAKDIDNLFTRFYRASNAVEKQFAGTGLGLAIVEEIVQDHGGSVRVESVEGEGTTIILEFPVYLSQAEKLVMDRRYGVLARAITALEMSSKQDLYHVTHDIGGSIGFYTFEEESRHILDFSRWLNSGIVLIPNEVESRRQSILAILKFRLASLLEREVDE